MPTQTVVAPLYIHTYIYTYIHTCSIRWWIDTLVIHTYIAQHKYIHTHNYRYKQEYNCRYLYTSWAPNTPYIYTYIHTYIHTVTSIFCPRRIRYTNILTRMYFGTYSRRKRIYLQPPARPLSFSSKPSLIVRMHTVPRYPLEKPSNNTNSTEKKSWVNTTCFTEHTMRGNNSKRSSTAMYRLSTVKQNL